MNKLICSDIDGTMEIIDGKFSPEIIEKVASIDSSFMLVSGRTVNEIRQFGLDVDMIGSNGGEIVKNGELIFDAFFDLATAKEIVEYLRSTNNMVVVHTPDGKIVEAGFDAYQVAHDIGASRSDDVAAIKATADFMFGHMYNNHRQVEDMLETIETEQIKINKMETFFEGEKEDFIADLTSKIEIDAFSSAVTNVEIVPVGVNKGNALTKYVADLDVTTFAIGDGDNDIPMFEFSDVKIAMGNGTENLKAIADYVVSDAREGGFIEALEIVSSYQK